MSDNTQPISWEIPADLVAQLESIECNDSFAPEPTCDTGTSGQRRSDGNIELVRFLDSHEGDGARAVFAGVQLLYKNNFPNDPPSKFAHR